jgi:surfeit locus 1 family protein
MRITFRFRWIPFIAAMTAVAIGVSLGNWQMRRADQKEAIESKLSAREAAPPVVLNSALQSVDDVEYRRVIAEGEFKQDWPVYLENRPYKGTSGFYLLTPLKIRGSDRYVLVARGWLPRDPANRTKLPQVETPNGTVRIEGLAKRNPGQLLQLGEAVELRPAAIVQNLAVDQFAKASGLAMQPFIIEQMNDTSDGLVRDWPRPSSGMDKHLGYAFQWYALAAMTFLFFIVTGIRRGTR